MSLFSFDRFPPNCSAGMTEEWESAGMTEEWESAGRRQERETELLITELLTGNKTEVGCAGNENTWVCKKIIDNSVDTIFFIGFLLLKLT